MVLSPGYWFWIERMGTQVWSSGKFAAAFWWKFEATFVAAMQSINFSEKTSFQTVALKHTSNTNFPLLLIIVGLALIMFMQSQTVDSMIL